MPLSEFVPIHGGAKLQRADLLANGAIFAVILSSLFICASFLIVGSAWLIIDAGEEDQDGKTVGIAGCCVGGVFIAIGIGFAVFNETWVNTYFPNMAKSYSAGAGAS